MIETVQWRWVCDTMTKRKLRNNWIIVTADYVCHDIFVLFNYYLFLERYTA